MDLPEFQIGSAECRDCRRPRTSAYSKFPKASLHPLDLSYRADQGGRRRLTEGAGMITTAQLASRALGDHLAAELQSTFGSSQAPLAEKVGAAARLALECL